MTAIAGGGRYTNKHTAGPNFSYGGTLGTSFGTNAATRVENSDARMAGLGIFRGQRTWLDFMGLHYDWVTEPAAPPPVVNNDNFFLVL